MRLTLRTLLAYLDNILEPNDAEDIGKKIEESEYASGLVHRIRDVMRRLRLGAPGLMDHGPQHDPNTVAEYLDNTLASEEVTDFEKVCLESDVQLAEVGSCHQILTLVLGEPAEIDPISRQRMYEITDAQVGAGPPPTPELDFGHGDDGLAERKHRPRPTVPEYLREPLKRRHWFPVTAALVLVVCFTGVLLLALGQFEPGTPLGNALVQWGVRAQLKPADELAAAGEGRGERGEGRGETELLPENEPAKEIAKETVTETTAAESATPTIAEAAKKTTSMPAPVIEPMKTPENETTQPPEETPIKPSTTELVIKSPVIPNPNTIDKADNAVGAPSAETVQKPEIQPPVEPSAAGKDELAPEKSAAPLPPEPLGRSMSNEQVLLKDDPRVGWVRVAAKQTLMPQQLLVLPTYRAEVTLTVGVTLDILGGTKIELLPSSPKELPGIRILYGRVVMMPLAQSGSRLRVAFGDRSGIVTFPDAESVAALDVQRLHAPGSNPEAGPPHIVADLYASAGGILWDEIGGNQDEKTMRLTSPQRVSFNAGLTSEPIAVKESPKWIENEPISKLDQRASIAVEQALPADESARLKLMELMTRPQKEVRWLTLHCLGYLGQYREMVAVLDDPAHKLDWADYIVPLREGIARDAESAGAIRAALEKQYPQKSPELYRMLWGYSNDDLQAGDDVDLVKSLDDDSLAVRVLSYWNLKDLTGLGLFYRPEITAAKRQQPIRRWKERLDAGEIRIKTPEEKAGVTAEESASPPPAAD